jgi:hypothetical protein
LPTSLRSSNRALSGVETGTSFRPSGKADKPTLIAAALASLMPVAVLAQSFEGEITLRYPAEKNSQITVQTKGGKVRMNVSMGEQSGVMINDGAGSVITLMPTRKIYVRPPVLQGVTDTLSGWSFTATGRHDTVLGYACEYYTVKSEDLPTLNGDQWCVTSALGFLGVGPAQGVSASVLRKTFPKGFFALKSVNAKGVVNAEVIKIERKSLDDALFAPPADYTEMKMPAMPGGLPKPLR